MTVYQKILCCEDEREKGLSQLLSVLPCIFLLFDYHFLMDSGLQMQMIYRNKGEEWVKGLGADRTLYSDSGWKRRCCSCIRNESWHPDAAHSFNHRHTVSCNLQRVTGSHAPDRNTSCVYVSVYAKLLLKAEMTVLGCQWQQIFTKSI